MNRRTFLHQSCGAMTSTSVMSTILHLKLATKAAAESAATTQDQKTLVCLFFDGGIDSFNLLIPRDDRYAQYAAARGTDPKQGGVAIPLEKLHHLTQYDLGKGVLGDGKLYGIHPSLGPLKELFNGLGGDPHKRRLSFISNVGTLIEPTTMEQYHTASYRKRPEALFSHADQKEQWQTSLPQGGMKLTGWAGRIADLLHDKVNTGNTSMSLSFDGNNMFQVGEHTSEFVMTERGALSLSLENTPKNSASSLKNTAFKSLLEVEYHKLMDKAFIDLTKSSIEQQTYVQSVFDSFNPSSLKSPFPTSSSLQKKLYSALKMISSREKLGLNRQTIFISMGGWDHHDELLNSQERMLDEVAPALLCFQNALEELGLAQSVITFTASEFGRTLRSNGRGTDHAWGGNQLLMGEPIKGGQVLGSYPNLELRTEKDKDWKNGLSDVGAGGRFLPTTAVDSFFGELIRWFGVSPTDLPLVLPNYRNFHSSLTDLPLGFLKNTP